MDDETRQFIFFSVKMQIIDKIVFNTHETFYLLLTLQHDVFQVKKQESLSNINMYVYKNMIDSNPQATDVFYVKI